MMPEVDFYPVPHIINAHLMEVGMLPGNPAYGSTKIAPPPSGSPTISRETNMALEAGGVTARMRLAGTASPHSASHGSASSRHRDLE